MGQTKRLLDEIYELETTITYPDDMDLDYENWLEQKQQEQLAYEEMLSDTK
jgi:hypothetical protein